MTIRPIAILTGSLAALSLLAWKPARTLTPLTPPVAPAPSPAPPALQRVSPDKCGCYDEPTPGAVDGDEGSQREGERPARLHSGGTIALPESVLRSVRKRGFNRTI